MLHAAVPLMSALQESGGGGGGGAFGAVSMLFFLAIFVLVIAGMWKVFVKAGKPGWASIIPIYNLFVLLDIAKRPAWWFILFLIPFVNIIILIVVSLDIARVFGKGAGFGIGLALLGFIFYPLLGFSDATYQG